MTWLKFCGITRLEDALMAAALGADAVGFVFAESPRRLDAEAARAIARALPEPVIRVGIFRDAPREEVVRVVERCELDLLQFHGMEDEEFCESCGVPYVKAVAVGVEVPGDYGYAGCIALLAEAPGLAGGSGVTCDWGSAARLAEHRRIILAGGLNPENVAEAIRMVRPFGVDVCSGIEAAPGVKDPELMRHFAREVKES